MDIEDAQEMGLREATTIPRGAGPDKGFERSGRPDLAIYGVQAA